MVQVAVVTGPEASCHWRRPISSEYALCFYGLYFTEVLLPLLLISV